MVSGESRSSGLFWFTLVLVGMLLFLLLLCVGVGIWVGLERGYFGGPSASSDAPSEAPAEASAGFSQAESTRPSEPEPAKSPPVNKLPDDDPEADSLPVEPPPDDDTGDAYEVQTAPPEGAELDADTPSVAGGSFFGVRADGRRFVYVVDCSGSMNGEPFARARSELLSSLANLAESQEFFVILFSTSEYPMFHPEAIDKYIRATDRELKRVKMWLDSFPVDGGTNPAPALLQALAMKPDAVFFLSDGAIPPITRDAVHEANDGRIPIHVIGFIDRVGETVLKLIANDNGGRYKFVQ